jgi:hypothetical protein
MPTLSLWMEASLKVMEDNLSILRELHEKGQAELVIEQAKHFKKHVDSFLDFLQERKRLA